MAFIRAYLDTISKTLDKTLLKAQQWNVMPYLISLNDKFFKDYADRSELLF